MNAPRLVVFTGDLNYTVRRNIVDLDLMLTDAEWLVVVHTPPRTVQRLLKNQRMNLRKNGWRWIPYQLAELLRRRTSVSPPCPEKFPGGEYEMQALRERKNVQILQAADIHATESVESVRDFAPDLGLSLAAPILKRNLFALPRLGTLNLHKGALPEFRGMPPAFWEMWTDQPVVGCSVHWVSDKLDEGDVLAQTTFARDRFSTVRGLQLRLDEVGAELVSAAVMDVFEGRAQAKRQPPGQGRTWRKPTLKQQSELAARQSLREPVKRALPLLALRNLHARAALLWYRTLGWRMATPRVTVLLYHRVSDSVRDNLSVGVEQFEQQLKLLRAHCTVVSLEQLLAMQTIPRSRRPIVALSFDDGYEDNFLHAAPLLRRYRVPCAFYVSTGIVGSERRFPHDERRGNPWIPLMSWDQLRQMQAWGFPIGSHTVHHIDCVAESEATVRSELERSRDDLVGQLGSLPLTFAYPYGGRDQMNPERLELVKEAGYQACLSAFGGSNFTRVDPFAVLRRGIHWQFSNAAFLCECVGSRA